MLAEGPPFNKQGDMSLLKTKVGREPRADGMRNYQLLLEAAKSAFNRNGSATRLEEIARSAGVGIATLYRHFPTREDLVREVYRSEIDQLIAIAPKLIKRHAPSEALRRWLHLFVEYLATKRLLAETLHIDPSDGALTTETSGVLIGQAVHMLVDRAVNSGEMTLALDPSDLLRSLVGVATIYPQPQWEMNAKRLADVMVAGMRIC